MPIYERGSGFQVSVGSGTDRFRATATSREEAEAIEKAELLKRKKKALGLIEERKIEPPKASVTLRKLLDMAKRQRWRSPGEKQSLNAELVVAILGEGTYVQDVDRAMLRDLVEELYEQGNSGATINRKLSALSIMLKIAEEEEWIERAPKLPRQKESEHRIRYFNNKEEAEMLAICHHLGMDELADFIVFGIETGFRRSEILRLDMRDVEGGMAVLHAGQTKSGKARAVPLSEQAQAVVDKRLAKGFTKLFEDLTNSQLRARWDVLKDNMREPGDHFIVHTLRHTCASRLAIAGQNAAFIQAWMGHSTITVTQRYMHLGQDTLRQGVQALSNYRNKTEASHLRRVA